MGDLQLVGGELVAHGGVKRAVEWPATMPEQRRTGFPKGSAGAGAVWLAGLEGDPSGQ